MKRLAIVLAAVIVLAACGPKKEQPPPPKPEEIRALEKAKETAKKLNEKTSETNEAGREANDQKSEHDEERLDSNPESHRIAMQFSREYRRRIYMVAVGRTSVADHTSTLKVGDAAPDFELPGHRNKEKFTLSEHARKEERRHGLLSARLDPCLNRSDAGI